MSSSLWLCFECHCSEVVEEIINGEASILRSTDEVPSSS